MKLFSSYVEESINYAFSDMFGVWVICVLFAITSLVTKRIILILFGAYLL